MTYNISMPGRGVDEIIIAALDKTQVLFHQLDLKQERGKADLIENSIDIPSTFFDIPLYTSCQHHV